MKIIMVSARAMVSDRLHGYECGADDYVTKPFDEGELFSKVRVFMRLKSVEEVDRMKTDVLSLISHTTHTPLNGILGSAEILLLDENPDPEEQRQGIRTIAQCAEQLHRLFQKVLLLTQLSSGALQLDRQPTDPADVVADAMGQVAGAASERGVEITLRLDTSAPVLLDREHLAMALAALLDNAVRFSDPGGAVELRLTSDEQHICMAVTDHGAGIEADRLSRLFRPLEDADVRHHSQGDGLSLALVQQILLQHGGSIDVESEKGVQTTFRLHLPAGAAAHASA